MKRAAFVVWACAPRRCTHRARWRACSDLPGRLDSDDQRTLLPLLATLRGPGAARALRASKALASPNRAIRAAAHAALGRVGDGVDVHFLAAALESFDDSSVRAAAAGALGELGARDTLPLLARVALDLTQPYIVRYSCVVALGALGGDDAIAALVTVRATPLEITGAVSALAEIPRAGADPRVREYVTKQAQHEDDLVRGAVARAYGLWSRADDTPDYFRVQLHDMLTREEITYNSPHVRNMLAQAVLPDDFVN